MTEEESIVSDASDVFHDDDVPKPRDPKKEYVERLFDSINGKKDELEKKQPGVYNMLIDYVVKKDYIPRFDDNAKGKATIKLFSDTLSQAITDAQKTKHNHNFEQLTDVRNIGDVPDMLKQIHNYYIKQGISPVGINHHTYKIDRFFDIFLGRQEATDAAKAMTEMNNAEKYPPYTPDEWVDMQNLDRLQDQRDLDTSMSEMIDYLSPKEAVLVRKSVLDGTWKQSPDEVVKKLMDEGYTEKRAKELDARIRREATIDIVKRKERIAKFAVVMGHHPETYQYLPEELQTTLNDYITEKYNRDAVNRQLHYVAPAIKPKWEKAVMQYHLNPLLDRTGWSSSNKHSGRFE